MSVSAMPVPRIPSTRFLCPVWLPATRELMLGRVLLKRFRNSALMQRQVLTALEEDGWPTRLDDPLPPSPAVDCHARLRDTVRRLNELRVPLIVFSRDGTGEGLRWSWAPRTTLSHHLEPEEIERLIHPYLD